MLLYNNNIPSFCCCCYLSQWQLLEKFGLEKFFAKCGRRKKDLEIEGGNENYWKTFTLAFWYIQTQCKFSNTSEGVYLYHIFSYLSWLWEGTRAAWEFFPSHIKGQFKSCSQWRMFSMNTKSLYGPSESESTQEIGKGAKIVTLRLLSPSGDLGIGLVWDNPTPDRTHILVWLLKSSSNWT